VCLSTVRELLPENPWAAIAVAIIIMAGGSGGGVWLTLRFRVNGLMKDLARHIKESDDDRDNRARDRQADLKMFQALRDGHKDNAHATEMLAQQIKTVCPYWDDKTGHHGPPK